MLRSAVEKARYWVTFSIYFLLIPVSVVAYGIKLFSKPKNTPRALYHAKFLEAGFITGSSSFAGATTTVYGLLFSLTVEKGVIVANIEGHRYIVKDVVGADDDFNLHETLCDLWLPGPVI